MKNAVVKVRGTTGFSFVTTLPPAEVKRVIWETVDRFTEDTPGVVDRFVDQESEHSMRVGLLIEAASFADADEKMQQLCNRIVASFAGPDEPAEVDERATELVPA